MRILGIDYGNTRTGIAITDPLLITVYGLKTIDVKSIAFGKRVEDISRKTKDRYILKELEEIVKEYSPSKMVVGMPYNENGTEGERVIQTKEFIHKLSCKFPGIEIVEQDERYTTIQAHEIIHEINIKNKKKKKDIVDQIAATVILESYIKSMK